MDRKEILCFSETLYDIESMIRQFIYKTCNLMRITAKARVKTGPTGNPELAPFFYKVETNNLLFHNIPQGRKQFQHYYYKLSGQVKKYLDDDTLLFDHEHTRHFHGFEDPAFYINEEMVACVISHEDELILYLSGSDIELLKQEGLHITSGKTIDGGGSYLEIVRG